jgi:hypothetical protein
MSDTPSYPLFDGRTEYREVKDGRVEWGNFGTVRPVERILDGKVGLSPRVYILGESDHIRQNRS